MYVVFTDLGFSVSEGERWICFERLSRKPYTIQSQMRQRLIQESKAEIRSPMYRVRKGGGHGEKKTFRRGNNYRFPQLSESRVFQ